MEIEALSELSDEELIDRLDEACQLMCNLKEENQNRLSLLEWGNKTEIEGGNYKAVGREFKRQFILRRVNGKLIANELPQTLRDEDFEPVTTQRWYSFIRRRGSPYAVYSKNQ